ncbi:FG-GAP repeat domain-containing protein [Tunicatimonas pelagia]|uniref:FG-GAP repeat domain-containing protein n=1 Tax=Tunicatimonas pelagia TaxID=931531 RepID=UPI002665A6F9|nr:VCBS repeat-containing protein [Tunicatimonas pelagia]WKN44568.1 VCBS repeat-containing protein [Tunicatimonas pelagia]
MSSITYFFLQLSLVASLPVFAQINQPEFTTQILDTIDIGYGLAIGDVNGDGHPDILLADQKEFVWYHNGDWQRFVIAKNLTERDNVCLAATDINQDGKIELAVGAQWNPGETSDTTASGSVHYLIRPHDPTQLWKPIQLHHEPTVHRMQWVATEDGYRLVVLPLHGRGNKNGEGKGVRVLAYHPPQNPDQGWKTSLLDSTMHLTHNFDVSDDSTVFIAGKEGVKQISYQNNGWQTNPLPQLAQGAGEVRRGFLTEDHPFLVTVEPMHGNQLVLYQGENYGERSVLFDDLKQGHALVCADLLGLGRDQVVVGWREPNQQGKVGIKIFIPVDEEGDGWMHFWIDEDDMACEDLKVADLDQDGDLDIVAAGRATKNLKVYWNQRIMDSD